MRNRGCGGLRWSSLHGVRRDANAQNAANARGDQNDSRLHPCDSPPSLSMHVAIPGSTMILPVSA